MSSNEKFQNRANVEVDSKSVQEAKKVEEESPKITVESTKKLPIINDYEASENLSKHERFSQWRENMLKRTKVDSSPEVQLQSLQV